MTAKAAGVIYLFFTPLSTLVTIWFAIHAAVWTIYAIYGGIYLGQANWRDYISVLFYDDLFLVMVVTTAFISYRGWCQLGSDWPSGTLVVRLDEEQSKQLTKAVRWARPVLIVVMYGLYSAVNGLHDNTASSGELSRVVLWFSIVPSILLSSIVSFLWSQIPVWFLGHAPMTSIFFGRNREQDNLISICTVDMSISMYRASLILPSLLLGLVPWIYGVTFGYYIPTTVGTVVFALQISGFILFWRSFKSGVHLKKLSDLPADYRTKEYFEFVEGNRNLSF